MSDTLTAVQIAMQTRIPVLLWGEPGTGKSKTAEGFTITMDERIWVVTIATREPADMAGMPVVREDRVDTNPPKWAREIIDAKRGILFFDELNTATSTTQAAALRVVQEGWVGDEKLPEETSFIAACNPPETTPGVYDLTAPMANRWIHINWTQDHAAWVSGMMTGFKPAPLTRLPPTWKSGIQQARTLVANFITSNPTALNDKPEDAGAQGRAWPSGRTWDMAAHCIAAAKAAGCSEKSTVTRILVSGCVGDSASREFFHWVSKQDLRSPEEYLKDPSGTPLPKRQDQVMTTLNAVASAAIDESAAKNKKQQHERYRAAWAVLGRVPELDLAIPAARLLGLNLPANFDYAKLPEEMEVIGELLEKAGIDFSQRDKA